MRHHADRHLRNVAIIAHVDHGKTTLVDALLKQSGSVSSAQEQTECIMDSNPLERERGITIFSKNCAVNYTPASGRHKGETYRINIIDTPGHADFGGEVERVLRMSDAALLLVDAFEGPMPQTRFVLSKALALGLRAIVVINKCDRAEARPDAVVNEVFDLLIDLGASDETLDFPVIYAAGRQGWATRNLAKRDTGMIDLFDAIVEFVAPPTGDPEKPLQLLITTLDYNDYVGRIAIGRVFNGHLESGQQVAICKADGSFLKRRVQRINRFEALGRVAVDRIDAGDLCAVEGLDDFEIGDTVADIDNPVAMPRVQVDEPTLHMVFRINDSPFGGQEGTYVTSRQIIERLEKELQTNVALRVNPGDTADELRVSGRGLLHLGVLLENMRREGFELSVGKPEVIEKEIDGVMCEPIELLSLDIAAGAMGPAMELLGTRNADIKKMEARGERMHIECEIPARGLIGMRTRLLNATGGESIMHHTFMCYAPIRSTPRKRPNGVMIATDPGTATTYSLLNLSDRGFMFVQNGDPVYTGQIVGEHSRDNDLDVNIVKAKQMTNFRVSAKEATVVLKPARLMNLEMALEYIEEDELVEITPTAVRLRKRLLDENERKRAGRRERSLATNA